MHLRPLKEYLRFSNDEAAASGRRLQSLSERVFRSRLIARTLFGIKFKPVGSLDYCFDVTTYVLYKYVKSRINSGTRLIDLGTGSMAVLGISLWKASGCRVTSCDINPELVKLAQQNVDLNRAPIEVRQSNLLDNAGPDFDTVVFNPPYVTQETGKRRGQSEERKSQWDGGEDGTLVIRKYLESLRGLERPLVSYLGMNHAHVERKLMESILERSSHIRVRQIYRHRILPVDVYALESGRPQ